MGHRSSNRIVLFDLWNTLIPLTNETKLRAFAETSKLLGVDKSELDLVWRETRHLRETTDLRHYLVALGNHLGACWSDETISRVLTTRWAIHSIGFSAPMPHAESSLGALRECGYRIGVISNGTSDVADMIAQSRISYYIDAVIVSADVGMMKPDPRIYHLAAEALDSSPSGSAYFGDGQDNELEGAHDAGCRPVLVGSSDHGSWSGERITSLADAPRLLGAPTNTKEPT